MKNHHILKSAIEAVVLCGKQNLSLRSHKHDNTNTSSNKGNLWAILEMMSRRDVLYGNISKVEKRMRSTRQKESKTKLLI